MEGAYLTPTKKAVCIVHNGLDHFDCLCVPTVTLNRISKALLHFGIAEEGGENEPKQERGGCWNTDSRSDKSVAFAGREFVASVLLRGDFSVEHWNPDSYSHGSASADRDSNEYFTSNSD